MQQQVVTTQPQPSRLRIGAAMKYVAPAVIVLLALAGFLIYRATGGLQPQGGAMPRSEAIEQRWGIRVTQIAVTADGGMVDFRYLVIDPDKALNLFEDESKTPELVAESNGTVISGGAAVPMAHRHDMRSGEVYFSLYHNTNGAVKSGSLVSVVIGDARLEHIVAK